MSSCRILRNMLGHSLAYAAGGALLGSVGAKVLKDAGYVGYSVLGACRAGAAGNSVVGGTIGAIKGVFNIEDKENRSFKEWVGDTALGTAMSSAGAALGYAMLKTAAEMPLDKTVAAIATGAGVMMGAGVALALVIATGVFVGRVCACAASAASKASKAASAAAAEASSPPPLEEVTVHVAPRPRP